MVRAKWVQDRLNAVGTGELIPFFKFPEGETVVTVDMNFVPEETETDFGDRTVTRYKYRILVSGKVYHITVGKGLERLILNALMKDLNPFTVIREGTDIDTTYAIKELKP